MNPILRGFNPDPSILRVGVDYYIATSTFEWFPGVRLHHSRDLVNWSVIGHALDERSGLDLRGIPDSGGVWAPSLSHSNGLFWLAYSIVRSRDGDDPDVDNYLITTESLTEGRWSEPVYLGSRGFDFSFFHDTDGRHWIVGLQWDQRPGQPSFSGLVVEEYLADRHRTSGKAHLLYRSEELSEGPNLYHLGDWYYLLIAEGGTGWNHGITVARSRSLFGPYERDPKPAVLTSRTTTGAPLQKAGHGELVQTPDGHWLLVHLASRPAVVGGSRFCVLGRETCLQRVAFTDDGWLSLLGGGDAAATAVDLSDLSGLPEPSSTPVPDRDDFDADRLDTRRWSTLRAALTADEASLLARPGWLRLRGGHSSASVFSQSMLAQRLEEHRAVAETLVDAEPASSRQLAGLLAWYDRQGWIWLQLSWDAEHGRHLRVAARDGRVTRATDPVPAPDGPVRMRFELDNGSLRFAFAGVGGHWIPIGGAQDGWRLSDDHGPGLRFTGAFAAIRAEDLDGTGWTADFDFVDVSFDPSGPP